jgi:hypothetical protein
MRVADGGASDQWGCAPMRNRCATHLLLQRRAQVLGLRSWPPWRGTRARPYVTLEAHAARDTVGRWQARDRQGQRHCGASFFPPRRSPSLASVEGGALDRPGGSVARRPARRVDRQRGAASIPCGLCTVELDRAARRRASRRDALKRRPPARVSRNGSGGHPTCPPTTSPVRQRAPAATATRGRWQRPEFFDERPRSRATLVGAVKGADRLTAPPRPRAPCGGWGLVPISMGSVVHTRGLRASARSLACEPTHRPPRQVSPLRT